MAAKKNNPDESEINYTQLFEDNNCDTLFVTSDKSVFVLEQYARMHAETLEDATVTIVDRKGE